MAQAAVPHMKSGSAMINTVGSVTGLLGNEALLDYSMTKGGIHAFTRSLASHFVARGIRGERRFASLSDGLSGVQTGPGATRPRHRARR
jgi:NADP-dependent 3-hydroxy acid dehydrogenase YdfG